MNPKTKGYILGAVAATTYGMNPLFAVPLYKGGMNPDSVLFFRYLVAVPIIALMIKMRGRSFSLKHGEIIPLILMGFMISLSSLTLFASYNYMDVGIASTLLFVYPIMVVLIMIILFHEKISLQTILCLTLTFCGILLLYKGEDGSTLSATGIILSMISALSYAIYIVGVNRPSLSKMPTLTITFYVLIFGVLLYALRFLSGAVFGIGPEITFSFEGAALTFPDKWYLWGCVLALAVFPTVISFICTTSAVHYIGSTPTAILGALEPVTAIFFGLAIFQEKLSIREGIGIAVIIIAVTLVVAGSSATHYFVRFRKMFPKIKKK